MNPGEDELVPRLPSHFGMREDSGKQLHQWGKMDE